MWLVHFSLRYHHSFSRHSATRKYLDIGTSALLHLARNHHNEHTLRCFAHCLLYHETYSEPEGAPVRKRCVIGVDKIMSLWYICSRTNVQENFIALPLPLYFLNASSA